MPKRPSSEAGEPGVGANRGIACRSPANNGRVASGAGGEMAQSGDAVNRRTTPKVGRNEMCLLRLRQEVQAVLRRGRVN
jgi:hypothetical protein